MLLFSTVLPINETLTKDAFIELAIRWNQGSHAENIIPNIEWNGEKNIRYGDDKLWMQIEEYRNRNIIAIRYEKTEANGVVWDTDYVMNFNDMKMSVRLDRSYLEEATEISTAFFTPAFIALLIDGGYVKDDNGLPIERHPVKITEENWSVIADVINGKTSYGLPVIYISKTFAGMDPVNIRDVAKRLKGVAHVFVQDNAHSGQILRQMCDNKNEYNGAIGIYFPNHSVGHEKILNHIYDGSEKKMTEKVVRRVIQYTNAQRIDMLYTWQGVNNALLRDKYTSKRAELAESETARRLVESAARMKALEAEVKLQNADRRVRDMVREVKEAQTIAQENKDLVDSVDEDIKQMQQQIQVLTHQNDKLSVENQYLRATLDAMSAVPILCLGSEEEFFPGEIKEFILQALEKELSQTTPHSRRADALGDVIRSNGGTTGDPEVKMKNVKEMLFNYSSMTGPLRSFLKELGFKIFEDGGHYKLVYYGDGRYWTTLAKTPSDKVHGGRNAAMEIIRKML